MWRMQVTRALLWVCVLAWGILLGGKLFDLVVIAHAWSASPPESLKLLPYGPRYPINPGHFFFPSSVALLVCSTAALVSGWRTPATFRIWLFLSPLMMFAILVFTIVWFWPHNTALWIASQSGLNTMTDTTQSVRIAHQWVAFDWVRVVMASVGFVAAIRALSIPFPLTSK
jgi:anthrone oxygenase-like protein